MNWITRWRGLRARGILGMNLRNAQCILDCNPRRRFPLVDAKSKMHKLCKQIGVPTPELYAIIAAHSALRHLPRLLGARSDFVLKPDRGAGGRGVLVVIDRQGDHFIRNNGEPVGLADLRQHLSSIVSGLYSLGGLPDSALIQQRIIPDPVFERISYKGTADVRVILYKDVPVMAMLRLPTKQSGGRANLHQGAVGAGVDIASGVTSRAVLANRVTDRHPDTDVSIVGVQVPHWPQILEMSRRVSRAVGLGYVGVDIVVDRRWGPLLLEANARPGLAIQIANGQGLLPRLEEVDRLQAQLLAATKDGKANDHDA
jgi:alpha-L-glutamate ligase-like protein